LKTEWGAFFLLNIKVQLRFAVAFCETIGTLLGVNRFLTKLLGCDGTLGAMVGHV
jgi:hypothetical protein